MDRLRQGTSCHKTGLLLTVLAILIVSTPVAPVLPGLLLVHRFDDSQVSSRLSGAVSHCWPDESSLGFSSVIGLSDKTRSKFTLMLLALWSVLLCTRPR